MVLRPQTPGVYEEVAPPPAPEPVVRDDVAAFVGLARRGPVDRAIRLEAWEEFVAWFGERAEGLLLADAVLGFFLNGGRTCWVVRVLHREAQPGEEIGLPASAPCEALTLAGTSTNPIWSAAQLEVDDPGTWANDLACAVRFRAYELRLPAAFLVNPTTITISGGRGERRLAPGSLLWIREGGVDEFVTVVSIDGTPGPVGDDVGPELTLRLASPIAVVSPRIAVVEAQVDAMAVSGQRERHEDLGLDPLHARYLPRVLASASRLVTLRDPGAIPAAIPQATLIPEGLREAEEGASPPDDLAIAVLSGGADGLVAFKRADFFDPLPDEERPETNLGVDQLRRLSDVSLVAIPDLVLPGDPPPEPPPAPIAPAPSKKRARFVCGEPPPPPTVPPPAPPPALPKPEALVDPELEPSPAARAAKRQSLAAAEDALVRHCESMGDRIALLAPSPSLDARSVVKWRRRLDSAHAATYFPWLRFGDPIARPPGADLGGATLRDVPPTGIAAGMIARTERAFGVARAPANLDAVTVIGPARAVTKDEWAELHQAAINVFRPLPTHGVRLLGARTLSSNRDLRYLHVRRLLTHLARRLERRMVWVVFEPHTESLRERVKRDVEAHLLRPLFSRGAFAGEIAETSYFVRCDDVVNPPASRDLGRLVCEVGVAPHTPAEFIVLRIETSRDRGVTLTEGV